MSIKKLMNIDIVRENIFSYISPVDTINYIKAGGNREIYNGINKEINIFKYIISDKVWLNKMISEGHTFILISPNTLDLVRHNINGYRACTKCKPQVLTMNMILVISKGDKHIGCNNTLLDKSKFIDNIVKDKDVSDTTDIVHKLRIIKIKRGNLNINILTSITDGRVLSSLYFHSSLYIDTLGLGTNSCNKKYLTEEFEGTILTYMDKNSYEILEQNILQLSYRGRYTNSKNTNKIILGLNFVYKHTSYMSIFYRK